MNASDWSALISLLVAAAVLSASYFRWWRVTWNGDLRTEAWVKVFLGACIGALVISTVLLVVHALNGRGDDYPVKCRSVNGTDHTYQCVSTT